MAYTEAWDEAKPAGTQKGFEMDDEVRLLKRALRERLEDILPDWATDATQPKKLIGSQILTFVDQGFAASGATRFYAPGDSSGSVTEVNVEFEVPYKCIIGQLRVRASGSPGAGENWTVTLRQNAADSSLTCAISGASATTCQDLANEITFAVGDRVALKITSSAGAVGVALKISARCRPTV